MPFFQAPITVREIVRDQSIKLRARFASTSFGQCLVAESDGALCHLSFIENDQDPESAIRRHWPKATIEFQDPSNIQAFSFSDSQHFSIYLNGTPFQLSVWKALLQIPRGTTVSYQQLATMAGHPTAVRAVGTAIGRNPMAVIIPCHRVIRADGSLGHYHWGQDRKQALLDWEKTSSLKSPRTE